MGESILLLQLLPHALQAQHGREGSTEGMAAFLDFAKAYDTLDRDFLFEAMRVGGASATQAQHQGQQQQQQQQPSHHQGGPMRGQVGQPQWDGTAGEGQSAKSAGMVGWARTLLRSTRAAAVVNGYTSPQRLWEAGVRQGCPLAPAMYLFAAWALHCWLQSVPEVGLHIGGRRMCATQYADDCVALLKACTAVHVEALKGAMVTFAHASGQRLNLHKLCLLPLGTPSSTLPDSFGGIPIRSQATTLGITFVNEAMQRRERDQQQGPQQVPHPLRQALEQVHRDEQEQLRASHRWARRDLGARHDQAWEVLREHLRATRPHRLPEHQQQRQIEREEDVEADLGRQLRDEELSLQRSHAQEVRELQQRQQQEMSQYAAHLPAHYAAPGRQPSSSQSPCWESLLATLATKCDKLARLSLSAFGRAFGVSGYALSKLFFYAEFAEVPSHVTRPLQALITGTVDCSRQRRARGIPSNLLLGPPREGGIGLIPWSQHVVARHAVWAKRLTHQLAQITPRTPPWAIAAAAILQAMSPIHPALQLLPSNTQPQPLPGPLERMRVALLSLGPLAPRAPVHPHHLSHPPHPQQQQQQRRQREQREQQQQQQQRQQQQQQQQQ